MPSAKHDIQPGIYIMHNTMVWGGGMVIGQLGEKMKSGVRKKNGERKKEEKALKMHLLGL